MIQQEDSPERRELAQDLLQVVFGLTPFEELADDFRKHGMTLRLMEKGDTTRFVIFDSKGRVFDHFDFIGDSDGLADGADD